jgi:RNA polymerase sigma-70 factor (ECF subfamily)
LAVSDFESLANAHKDAVYRQLIRTCGNPDDAEDVLVEALMRAYQNLEQLREHTAFRAWLAQIGRRVCWHLRRREELLPIVHLSALETDGFQPVDPAPLPDASVDRQRMRELLQEAVDRLAPEYRKVYELRDLQGYSGAEVAEMLGISLAAQKSRLHRARTQVRRFLDRALAEAA